MKKIKFLIASMLGAIALVFACVLGTRVNASDKTISADFTDISATISANSTGTAKDLFDAGWKYVVTNGSQTVGDHSYGKIKPAGYIQSPNIVDENGATVTKSVNISISVYTCDTKNTLPFTISAYDSSDAVVATSDGTAGGTGVGFQSNDLVLTSTTNDIQYVKFVGCYKDTSAKNGCVSTFTISYAETVENPTDEDASKALSSSYSFDATKLTATADQEELTAAEVSPFELFETEDKTGFTSTNYIKVKRLSSGNVPYVEFRNGGLKFYAPSDATLTITARGIKSDGSGNSYFALFDSIGNSIDTTTSGLSKDDTYTDYYALGAVKTLTFELTSGTYFITFNDLESPSGRNGRLVSASVSFDQTAKLQRQVSTDKTAIRFVGTLEGFDAYTLSQIDSLKYTIKVEGYKAFDKEISTVYTSIKSGETTICAAKANTYYCSYLFTNLLTENNNKSLVGKNISAYLTVKLLDGTTIKTNSVGYTIVAA